MGKEKKRYLSYSQFSLWNQCPWHWKLRYIDKLKVDVPSIHLIFGSAFHTTLQAYVEAFFAHGPKYANTIDLYGILREEMSREYKKLILEHGKQLIIEYKDKLNKDMLKNNKDGLIDEMGKRFVSSYIPKEQMGEFYFDGEKIIDYFLKNRADFFNYKDEELVGIELVLDNPLKPKLSFIGFIDIIIKNKKTGKYKIIDLKTSTKGWTSYKKNDENTKAQLVLYKKMYADKFKKDINDIDIEFLILKRKLYEDIPYPQKRITRYIPPSGKPTINKVMTKFNAFVETVSDEQGNFIKNDAIYPKIPLDANCKFCEYKDIPELCDKNNN